jgi:hypothetical protein
MTGSPPQTPRTPDALEELRRDRGEGWQWHRIQMEPCPQCGDFPASLSPPDLGPLTVERAASWRDFLVEADDEFVRTSPEFGVFSPIQYGAHVRDIVRVYTDRVVLGLEQDTPTVPIFNPPQEQWELYNRLDTRELGSDIVAQAERLEAVAANMETDNWRRIVVNDRGVYGVYSFTLAGLACNAAHETHHHLLDAKGTLNQTTSA